MMHKCKEMGLYNVVQIFPSVFYCRCSIQRKKKYWIHREHECWFSSNKEKVTGTKISSGIIFYWVSLSCEIFTGTLCILERRFVKFTTIAENPQYWHVWNLFNILVVVWTITTACPQVFSSGGTCTLLPSFLGVHPHFWGCNVPL
jgi:hypothetical protein